MDWLGWLLFLLCRIYSPMIYQSYIAGMTNAKVQSMGHTSTSIYGIGKKYTRTDCDRLLRKLTLDGVLREELCVTAYGACGYVRLGHRAKDIMCGKQSLYFYLITCNPLYPGLELFGIS